MSLPASTQVPTGILLTKHNYRFYSNTPYVDHDVTIKSTKSPIVSFAPETSTQRPSNVPILKDIHTIVDILKQNKSEENKVREIVEKLNLKRNLTRINIIHTKRNVTNHYGPTFPKVIDRKNYTIDLNTDDSINAHKGSKELKVQFVLDCDLKNALNKDKTGLNANRPQILPETYSYVADDDDSAQYQKKPYYYSAQTALKTQRKPTFTAYTTRRPQSRPRPQQTIARPTTKAPKIKTKQKQKQKIKYVDPPGISALSSTFENVYNFFEEAFTDNVVLKKPPINKVKNSAPNRKRKNNRNNRRQGTKNGNRKPVTRPQRRKPIVKRSTAPTLAPGSRSTQPAENKQKQHLTTKIHVTSEYVAPETKPTVDLDDRQEEEIYDDYGDDDDEDDYYYDSFGVNDEVSKR